jgi:hypothetical protein
MQIKHIVEYHSGQPVVWLGQAPWLHPWIIIAATPAILHSLGFDDNRKTCLIVKLLRRSELVRLLWNDEAGHLRLKDWLLVW